MKIQNIIPVIVLSLALANSAFGRVNAANDTSTRIVSDVSQCKTIIPTEAYYTTFAGSGKALVVKAAIKNESYHKSVYQTHSNGQSAKAINSSSYWQYPVVISYDSESNGYNQVTLIDQQVGMELADTIILSVTMNGSTSHCEFKVGK